MSDYISPAIKQSTNHYLGVLVTAWTIAIICCISPQNTKASDSRSESELHFDGQLPWLTEDGATITTIAIEIADTRAQRIRGLRKRPVPDFSQGMLFVYQNAAIRSFIMTDTPTSLDIIFIDENSRVINIHRHTRPMSKQTYNSAGPALFVVEVRAGFCDLYGIQPGIRILWKRD